MEGTHNNDNDTWQTLGFATARLLVKIDEKHNEHGKGASDAGNRDKSKDGDHARYIDQRLRDLAAFERRAAGGPRRKRI